MEDITLREDDNSVSTTDLQPTYNAYLLCGTIPARVATDEDFERAHHPEPRRPFARAALYLRQYSPVSMHQRKV